MMKRKSTFTKEEADQIIVLIELKLKADSSKQKSIRDKIRKLGFYAQEMGVGNGYNVADFKRVVTIIGEKKLVPVKTISKSTSTKVSTKTEISNITALNSGKDLKKMGFTGFVTIDKIAKDYSILPKQKGVYVLLFPFAKPEFLKIGTGGHFKQKNPNVNLDILQENWIAESSIIYIGKAGAEGRSATLQSRLKQYFRFGQGEAVGHWGGRYIWQLKNTKDIIVCWKEMPNEDPRTFEKQLIATFIKQYGKRPFANLVR